MPDKIKQTPELNFKLKTPGDKLPKEGRRKKKPTNTNRPVAIVSRLAALVI